MARWICRWLGHAWEADDMGDTYADQTSARLQTHDDDRGRPQGPLRDASEGADAVTTWQDMATLPSAGLVFILEPAKDGCPVPWATMWWLENAETPPADALGWLPVPAYEPQSKEQ